ncbi:hypothetical protein ACVWZ6_003736 [Bradyrhizobium sp. GM6.1]
MAPSDSVSGRDVSACMKSSMSSPAVNTPEPPVMIMQRMSGLFCAVSIARLISRYMSCVIAFFLLGRRRVITRVPRSSLTTILPFGMRGPCGRRDTDIG